MAIVSDQSIFNFVSFYAWTGQYMGSQGTQDIGPSFTAPGIVYTPTTAVVDFLSPVNLTHGFNTHYKMQGYNDSTGAYEVWYSRQAPLLIPPSGNRLSNIEIVLTWTDR